jgi:hypothetical protein
VLRKAQRAVILVDRKIKITESPVRATFKVSPLQGFEFDRLLLLLPKFRPEGADILVNKTNRNKFITSHTGAILW